MTTFYIKSVSLTDEQTEEYEGIMAGAFHVLSDVDRNVRNLRDEFKKGRLCFVYNKAAREAMQQLIDIEDVMVAAHVRGAGALAYDFSRGMQGRGWGLDDFMQVAVLGIYDAIYTFNGEAKFSTYAWLVMRRRLIDCIRSIKREASWGSLEDEELIPATDFMQADLTDMLDEADLTDFERELVTTYMKSGRGWQTEMAESTLKSNGEPYSKASISLAFRKACGKIERVYNDPDQRKAA